MLMIYIYKLYKFKCIIFIDVKSKLFVKKVYELTDYFSYTKLLITYFFMMLINIENN